MAAGIKPTRNRAIDHVRLASTALLVVYHASQTYDTTPFYHLKAARSSQLKWLTFATLFCRVWHMPVFFLVAGWALPGSLAQRGLMRVLGDRSRKLLLPLGFGMVAFGPYLRWIELKHGLLRSVSGHTLPPEVITFKELASRYFSQPGMVTWAHLWFLAYLWTFTMLYLPVWVALTKAVRTVFGSETGFTGRMLSLAHLLPLFAVASTEVLLRDRWPGYQNLFDDWANFATYSVFFGFGMVLGHKPALCQTLGRHSGALLTAGVVASICQTSLRMQGTETIAYHLLTALGSYGCASGIVGLALDSVVEGNPNNKHFSLLKKSEEHSIWREPLQFLMRRAKSVTYFGVLLYLLQLTAGDDIRNSPSATIDDCCQMCQDSLSQWAKTTYNETELGYYYPVRGTCLYWTYQEATKTCFQKNPLNYDYYEDFVHLVFHNSQSEMESFTAKYLNKTDNTYHVADSAFRIKEAPGFFAGSLLGLINIQHSIGEALGGSKGFQVDLMAEFDNYVDTLFVVLDVLNSDKCDKPHCQEILARIKPSILPPLPQSPTP